MVGVAVERLQRFFYFSTMNEQQLHEQLAIVHNRMGKHKPGNKFYDALLGDYWKLYAELSKIMGGEKCTIDKALADLLYQKDACDVLQINQNTLNSYRDRLRKGTLKPGTAQELLTRAGWKKKQEELWGK